MDIHALMDTAYERGASDLHISVGRPPVLRVSGGLVEIGDAPLNPEDTERMAKALAPERCCGTPLRNATELLWTAAGHS